MSEDTSENTNSTRGALDSPGKILSALWLDEKEIVSYATAAELSGSQSWLTVVSRLLFAVALGTSLLLIEKMLIQAVAEAFHKVTYSDRIQESKVRVPAYGPWD